jgi:hypothetical protein
MFETLIANKPQFTGTQPAFSTEVRCVLAGKLCCPWLHSLSVRPRMRTAPLRRLTPARVAGEGRVLGPG